jgi:prevent-host-death family protein
MGDSLVRKRLKASRTFALIIGSCKGRTIPTSGRPAEKIEISPLNGYIFQMTSFSVAEARNHLSEVIDRALAGEEVIVTRHGQPVVEIRPLHKSIKQITQDDIDWLKRGRVGRIMPASDATSLVSQLRDENERH